MTFLFYLITISPLFLLFSAGLYLVYKMGFHEGCNQVLKKADKFDDLVGHVDNELVTTQWRVFIQRVSYLDDNLISFISRRLKG